MSDVDVAALIGEPVVLSQRGQLKSFAWLSLRNGLLNLITLTLYRFWGKTEVRRRLWATTYLNDEAFEYTGRGVELFVGFLLALLVLVLPYLCVIFAGQFLGPLFGLLILPLYFFVTSFWAWAGSPLSATSPPGPPGAASASTCGARPVSSAWPGWAMRC